MLGDRSYVTAGVMPNAFAFPSHDVDAWIRSPIDDAALGNVGSHRIIGRLRKEFSPLDARNEADALLKEWRGDTFRGHASVVPFADLVLADVRPVLLASLAASALVLIVACANVVLLLLTRALKRRQDVAVRVALGCRWGRLARTMVIESALTAAAGVLLGLALAYGALRVFRNAATDVLPRVDAIALDRPVVLAILVASLAVAFGCGLVTMLSTSGRPVLTTLRGSTQSITPRGHRLRSALVVGQLALSVVLLTGAGLLTRTIESLVRLDAGFRPEHVLTVTLVLSDDTLVDASPSDPFVRELMHRVRTLPGVQHVGMASTLPPRQAPIHIGFRIANDDRDEASIMSLGSVTPGYFSALGTRLIRGRFFDESDALRDDNVIILSESATEFFFPDEDAVGKTHPGLPPVTGVHR